MKMQTFPGRLGIEQRVLPAYRADFFDKLADTCQGGLSVLAGQPRQDEGIHSTQHLEKAVLFHAKNWHLSKVDSPFFFCWQSGLIDWLDQWDPDALIVEANPRYLSTRMAVRWMHTRSRPVLGWGLGAPPLKGCLTLIRKWERLAFLKSLDGVIAYSRIGAKQYRDLGLSSRCIFHVCNAAAPKPTTPPPDRARRFADRPCVLFVGRLQERKRVDLLLRACAILPPAIQPRLVIVGDGPAKEAFQSLAYSIYPHAEFPGAHHGDQLKRFFFEADLFVLPGTGGLALQEAMTYGLPVIAAEGDGTQQDLVRPENGWLMPPGDSSTLAEILQTALSDIPRLRRMGVESFRIVSSEINVERMALSFVEVLNSIIRFPING